MKYKIVLILILLFAKFADAQTKEDISPFSDNNLQEQVYLHYNSSLLLPGESLLYTFYNLNETNHQLSEVSKIAKVELQNSKSEIIFSHTIHLNKGVGYSDFLIPASLPTGIYHLIGYTNWMGNFNLNGRFDAQIVIVNPYLKESEDNVELTEEGKMAVLPKDVDYNGNITLDLDKNEYSKREIVSLEINGNENVLDNAVLSISVRKIDSVINWSPIAAIDLKRNLNADFQFKVLPEIRGRNIVGKITSDSLAINKKLSIAYSVPGHPEKFRIFESKNDGSFNFQLSDKVNYNKAYIEVIGTAASNYKLNFDPTRPEFDLENINKISIPFSAKEEIESHAIHNQIQQSYKSVNSDSIIIKREELPFYGNKAVVFKLDDYTRFKTMQETFVEIIEFASFKRYGDHHVLEIRGFNEQTNFGKRPLLLIDGIMVSDHDYLFNLDPTEVENIEIVRDKYFLGPEIFQGIVNIETNKDAIPTNSNNVTELSLKPAENSKLYFQPDYSDQLIDYSKTPDFRYQLLWNPSLDNKKVQFYTSDISGTFEIRVEGFQENGKPISLKKTFRVRK